jgi:hypothetical protein
MKKSPLILVTSAALLLSLGAAAAPPGGMGGGGMGGARPTPGMPGSMSDHGNAMGRSEQDTSSSASHGRSVSDLLQDNAKLSAEIKELTGTDAQQACAGFKTLGDCVSAAHVSKNLGIPFDTLRSKLTGSGALTLGKAIHELKPDADTKGALRTASKQTKEDLHSG